MPKTIDCMFIGNNSIGSNVYSQQIKSSKVSNIGIFPGLSLDRNSVKYKGKIYLPSELLYMLTQGEKDYQISYSLTNRLGLTIPYLATFLQRKGLTFDFVNSFQKDKEELARKLKENDIKTIAIPTTIYVHPHPIVEIISFIKKYNTSAKIIVGGPYIYNCASVNLEDEHLQKLFNYINADVYINSTQGEVTLSKLVYNIKHGLSIEKINNIYFKDTISYKKTEIEKEDNNIDENYVDWSLFKYRMKKLVSCRTSLSCCFRCSFCTYHVHAGKYQTMSIECIEKELDAINDTNEVETICFIDDTFNIPQERFKNILKTMIRKKYKFKWASFFRCQYADEETLELMKESGCQMVFLGIESGSNKILKNMNKAVTVEQYVNGIKLLNKYGIPTFAAYIIGFPGETLETWGETLSFIEEYKPTFNSFSVWHCTSDSPIWSKRDDYKLSGLGYNWRHETMDVTEACSLYNELYSVPQNFIVNQLAYEDVILMLNSGLNISDIQKFSNIFSEHVRKRIADSSIEISNDEISSLKEIISKVDFG